MEFFRIFFDVKTSVLHLLMLFFPIFCQPLDLAQFGTKAVDIDNQTEGTSEVCATF